MNHIVKIPAEHHQLVKLQNGGRIVIPAELRKALGISIGDELIIEIEGDGICIYSSAQALKRAQNYVQKYTKGKKGLVEELISERRREAKRELREFS